MCEYGVPQGSVLRSILFLFFINDIHRSLSKITIKLFADDTNCFISEKNFNSLERLVEIELNKLQKWINANKLTINFDPKKSSYCIFKLRGKCFPINFDRGLKIGSNLLKYKETTKYTGIILDSNRTWESHIKELNQKLIKYTGIFSKVQYCLPVACRKNVYNAFIFSRLNYGSEIYVNTTKTYIQTLDVNKLLRILQFKHITMSLRDIYREFSTLKLKDSHYFNTCCRAHKFIHSPTLLPEAINDIFCRNDQIQDHDTRYKKNLHPAKIKTKLYGEKTISSQGTTFWEKLPRYLKETTSASIFKEKLKKCMLDNY